MPEREYLVCYPAIIQKIKIKAAGKFFILNKTESKIYSSMGKDGLDVGTHMCTYTSLSGIPMRTQNCKYEVFHCGENLQSTLSLPFCVYSPLK